MQSIFSVEENLSHARSTEFQEKGSGTTGGATATAAAVTATIHKCKWATFYTDTDSILQIKDDTTVIWEVKIIIATAGKFAHFPFPEPLVSTVGKALTAVIANSSSDCFVSFGGFSTKP